MNQDIQSLYKDTGNWYPGNISKVNKNGTYEIKWLDDDDDDRSKNNSNLRPGYYVNQKVKVEIKKNIWREGVVMKILLSGKYTVRLNETNENINARYEKLKPIDKFKIIRDEPIEEDVVPTNVSQKEKPDPTIAMRKNNYLNLKSKNLDTTDLKQYKTLDNDRIQLTDDETNINQLYNQLIENAEENFTIEGNTNEDSVRVKPIGCANRYKKIYDCETFEQDYINNQDTNKLEDLDEMYKLNRFIYGYIDGNNDGNCVNGFEHLNITDLLNSMNIPQSTVKNDDDIRFIQDATTLANNINSLIGYVSDAVNNSKEPKELDKRQLNAVWSNEPAIATSLNTVNLISNNQYNTLITHIGFIRADSTLKCYYFTSELTNGDTIFDSSLFRYLQDETAGTNVKKHCSEIGQNTRHYTKDDPNYVSMGCWLNPTFTWLKKLKRIDKKIDR